MSALGRLAITLALDATKFTDGLTKAEYQANKFAKTLGGGVAAASKIAVTGLSAMTGAAIAAFTAIDQLTKKTADFQDIAEMTGTTAENFAALTTAIDTGGGSAESTAAAMIKLTKGLAGADEETKGAAQAVQALGFNLEEFQKLDPAEQYEKIAFRLSEFADGAGKTAAALALMGKSGAAELPVMKALVEQGGRQVILTQEMIDAADEYADKQAKVRSQISQYTQVIASKALPALVALQEAFAETLKSMFGLDKVGEELAKDKSIEEFAYKTARVIGFVVDAFDGVQRAARVTGTVLAGVAALPVGNWEGMKRGLADIAEQVDAILMPEMFSAKLERAIAAQQAKASAAKPKENKPTLDAAIFAGDKSKEAEAAAKKLLDKQLSDLDNFIKSEDRLLSQREAMLSRMYANDQISIATYFEGRKNALEANLAVTVSTLDAQIAALEKFAAMQKKAEDKAGTQAKIGDLGARKEDVIAKNAADQAKLEDERRIAAEKYADQVAEITAKVLELQGTEEAAAKAALIRFDIQNRALLKRAAAEGDSGTQAAVGALRVREENQAKVNALLADAALIQDRLSTAEAKLQLERDVGLRGELETLSVLGERRREASAQLQEIARRYLEIAEASGDKKLIQQAEAFNQKINELAASADVLTDKLRSTFSDSFASAFDQFVQGTITAKQAFRQFATDVLSQINKMLATEFASSLFGKTGGGTGVDLFGSAVSGIAGLFGGGQNLGGVFADGGIPPVGKISLVGERGPELFVPSTSGRIIPNSALGGSTIAQTVNFILPSAITKSTQNQIASRTLVAAQRAVNRGVAA